MKRRVALVSTSTPKALCSTTPSVYGAALSCTVHLPSLRMALMRCTLPPRGIVKLSSPTITASAV